MIFEIKEYDKRFREKIEKIIKKLEYPVIFQISNFPNYCCFINNTLVGFICLKSAGNSLEITNIGIDNDFQKKGLGKKLLDFVINLAKSRGFQKIILYVENINLKAINLYKKMGFQKINSDDEIYILEKVIIKKT